MSPDSPCTPDVPDVSLTNIRAASPLPDQLIARVIPRVRLNVSINSWLEDYDDVSPKKNKNKKYEPSLIALAGFVLYFLFVVSSIRQNHQTIMAIFSYYLII